MKKIVIACFLSVVASVASAGLITGFAAVLSGPRWTITNISVASSDRFYVGLDRSSSNQLALDLLLNASNMTRFNAYGDYGTRAGGTGLGFFVGYGYIVGINDGLHLNLRDELNSNWNCYVDANMNGSCNVYNSVSRLVGSVHLQWNP